VGLTTGGRRQEAGGGRTDFPFSILDFSFVILTSSKNFSRHRLESGLVRLVRRGTSALSKRRVENYLDDVKMTNEKSKISKMINGKWKILPSADCRLLPAADCGLLLPPVLSVC
jgi:hypothetical protein